VRSPSPDDSLREGSPRRRSESGAVTAEFAAVLPAVVIVLVLSLACLQVASVQLSLQSATSDAARLLGRGGAGAESRVSSAVSGAHLGASRHDGLVCAMAEAPADVGGLVRFTITASACALDESALAADGAAGP
jgi:Flp pilus assembly protein TadG